MNKEDQDIRALFSSFDPAPGSDSLFMAKLEGNMRRVELLKEHAARRQRSNRRAMVVAVLTGFVMGVVLTLLYPMLMQLLGTMSFTLPRIGIKASDIDWQLPLLVIMALAVALTSMETYRLLWRKA